MKNLKKVLLALVVVAMLVSSIVTIAIANESGPDYTGSVEEAQTLYNVAIAEDIEDDLAKQSEALAAFYAYIDANPIDPAAEGYAALIEAYNLFTYTVADGLYDAYLEAMSTDNLAAVFTHVAAAPSLDETVAIDGVEYGDFAKKVNLASVEYADALIDALFAKVTDGSASYYEYLAAQQALAKFFDEVKKLSYTEVNPNPDVYTGSTLALKALIGKINPDATIEELQSGLAEIYNYLRETPVNPATDEFAAFLTSYNEKCKALTDAFSAKLDSAKTVKEQVDMLKAMRDYLDNTAPLSETVINAFNAKLAEIVEEYNKFADNFEDGAALGAELEKIEEIEPVADLADINALIAFFDNDKDEIRDEDSPIVSIPGNSGNESEASDQPKISAFIRIYKYLAANEIDPAAAGYAEFVVKYNSMKDIVVDILAKGVIEPTDLNEKIEGLMFYGEFLESYPLSEDAINEYNTLKSEVVELLNNFSNALKKLVLPTYTYIPAAPHYSTDVAKLNYMLSRIENADGETAEAKLDAQKAAMSAMYTYLLAVEINTEEDGYVDFVEAYNAEREELTTALLATIDAAEPDAKVAAFEVVKDYLVKTPYCMDAVLSYNEKVAETYAEEGDKATRERLTIGTENIYFAITEIFEFFMNSEEEPPIDEVFANIEALYVYSLRNYDITDDIYYDFVDMCDEIFDFMGQYLNDSYTQDALINANIDKVSAVCEFYKKVPFSQAAIEEFSAMIDTPDDPTTEEVDEANGFIQMLAGAAGMVEETFPSPTYIYNELNPLVDAFNKAEGLDNRIEAFKALYNAKSAVENTILTSVQAGDAAFRAAYDKICDEMADEIVASVIADVESAPWVQLSTFEKAYGFLKDYKFSNDAVEEYNAKLEIVRNINYAEVANLIITQSPELEYESPEATESDFTALKGYIDAAADSDEDLIDAYGYLGGNFDDAKAFDFAKTEFTTLLETFSEAKATATKRYTDDVDDAELDARPEALERMYKFVKANRISSYMVDSYNAKCADVGDAFTAEFNAVYAPYAEAVAAIHDHLKKCAADPSLLTEAELAVYNDVQLRLDALEYTEVYGQILDFKITTRDDKYAFIVQNQKVDAITGYLNVYEVTENYSEYALANSLFAQAAEDFISFYAETVEFMCGDDEVMKAEAVSELKAFIEEEMFCKVMADLFNATFAAGENDAKIDYDRVDYLPDEATGTLVELSDLMKAYMDCQMKALGDGEEYTQADYGECMNSKLNVLIELFTYLEENPLDPTSLLETLMEDVNDAKAYLEELTQVQKDIAAEKAPASEFELDADVVTWDFEDGKKPSLGKSDNITSTNIATQTLADGTENKYWVIESGTGTTNAYFNMPMVNTTIGTVFEFDLMIPMGATPMWTDFRPIGKAPNVSSTAYMMNDLKDGKLDSPRFDTFDPTHPNDVDLKISEGEWTHFIVVLNPVDFKITLYVDYIEIGKADLVHGGKIEYPITPTNLRICFVQSKNATIAIDNLKYYPGTSYRQLGKFDNMSEGDKFKYYVDFFRNEECEPVSRYTSYNKAADMVDTYRGQEAYKDYVEAFDLFDIDSIFSPAEKAKRLAKLVEMMGNVGADNVNSKNYTEVVTKIAEIEAYMIDNSYYLDKATFEYNDVKAKIVKTYAEIERVKQIPEIVDVLELFTKASTVAGMTRRAAEAVAVYERFNLADSDNYDKVSNDPSIVAFLATVGKDITLDMFYNEIIPERIAERTAYDNAGKIVAGVKRLEALVKNADGLSENEFLAALIAAATAEENSDYANAYMNVIRNTIKADNYDKTYEGLDEAIKVFNYLDSYFYKFVVEEQLDVIQKQLDRYSLTSSYIDKLGICTYVRNYIAENSVDVKDPLIAPCYAKLLSFEEELKSYEADYKLILQSNTAAFIALVERMSAFVEYRDIKPLYDEALNNYYYNMNIDSEAAKVAAATFEVYDAIVKATEENSTLFVEAAKKLSKATKTSAIYKALVECAAYVDGVDASIDGVADALEVYNAKLSAYNAKINPVNAQIEDTANVVCSVRTISIDATVLATVKKIINK